MQLPRLRSRDRCWNPIFAFCMPSLVLSIFVLLSFTEACLLPWHCDDPSTPQDDLGVGFDLTASYGTAVIRYRNRTGDAHIFLDAHPEYQELMYRLSLDSSRHLAPPYADGGEWYDDQPRQWRRKIRKLLGFPASRDVGILGRLLGPLREIVEQTLGHKVGSAVVTSPNLVALYHEDINDAMEYVGLKPLYLVGAGPDKDQPHEASAADAGYGEGLCSHYKDFDRCENEERQMPVREVLTILYTKNALIMYKAPKTQALEFYDPPSRGSTYFSLGSNSIHDNPQEEYYWENMKDAVMEMLLRYGGERDPVTHVIVTGESALNPRFLEVVNSSISAISEVRPVFFQSDPTFAAAKGAAEFAIRAPWATHTPPAKSASLERAGDADL